MTRYRSKAPNVFVVYRDRQSKSGAEGYCLHLEWRIKGASAFRRAGFASVMDLLHANHREFWQSRLTFYRLDPDILGRRYCNWIRQRPRRTPRIIRLGKFSYNLERRAGGTIIRALGSTQAVVDAYRHKLRVRDGLQRINVDQLLPAGPLSYDRCKQLARYAQKPLITKTITRIPPLEQTTSQKALAALLARRQNRPQPPSSRPSLVHQEQGS